ncbi:hypothetical protein C7974DRAFT_397794 [Boeremia exigua]|uniref:uncharacterized protein n=1 Tax=Boeremia exigua TaxID=749465 RepID=UPI001E8D83B9|nr:uncharacterized protein C7974DRAFT_397794 [Boeremia exigua]KAH6622174.1 hypothetical protein C7974DRAFT_397794 [Boeremia exigua]
MPLFSSHANDTVIEYSTVESDPGHYSGDTGGRNNPYHHETQAKQPGIDISAIDGRVSHTGTPSNGERDEKGSNTYVGPPISGWPTAPQRLRGYSVPLLIGDILLILLPIAFIVLAISAWRLDKKTLSGNGRMVERAMSLGPTIYPLAFAAIGSRCLRNIAVRLAERGTTVLTLEKLLGSQSLVSAIGTACSLRSANFISICLLLLWALSPLGGQSSLRLLHETNSTISENGTIYYSDPAAIVNLDEAGEWSAVVPAILTASLASSMEAKNRPVDSWSHPKVPRLDVIEQQALRDPLSEGSWIDVDPTLNHTYSSWTGINIQNLRQTEHAAFQVRYNYMYLDQRSVTVDSPENVYDGLIASGALFPPLISKSNNGQDAVDMLNNVTTGSEKVGIPLQKMFLRVVHVSNSTQKAPNPLDIRYGFDFNREPINFLRGAYYLKTDGSNTYLYFLYTYTPRIVTVDAKIECQASDCIVTRLRHVPSESSSSLKEACDIGLGYRLGCMTTATNAVSRFLAWFPAMMASFVGTSDIFDIWAKGWNDTFVLPTNLTTDQISDQEKANRITTLLNTYWQGSSWGYQVTRAGFFDRPDYPWSGDPENFPPARYINASEAVFSHPVAIYQADVGWIVSLLIISVILLLLGVVNVAFAFMTIAPDLFYYASSLARENPYTKTPDGGTMLDGAQRSRMLKNMKVQIADVSPENQVGYVVLKSVDDDDFLTGRLKKGKLYW